MAYEPERGQILSLGGHNSPAVLSSGKFAMRMIPTGKSHAGLKWNRLSWLTITGPAGIALAATAGAVSASSSAPSGQLIALLLITTVTVGFSLICPVHVLPTAALIAYVVLPQHAIGYVRGAAPAAVLLTLWAVRRFGETHPPRAGMGDNLMRAGGLAVGAWGLTLLTLFENGVQREASSIWLVAFALGVLIPLLQVTDTSRETQLLWRVWPILTILVACYMLAEFALQANLIYDSLYSVQGRPLAQTWSVYRSHGPFGHPLYAATFFAASTAAALGRQISQGRGSLLWFVAGSIGLLTTFSRGALLALAVAAVAMLLAALALGVRRTGLVPIYTQLFVGASVVAVTGLIQSRANSAEARISASVRSEVFAGAVKAAEYTGWRGSGAATSDLTVKSAAALPYLLENSALQIGVSLGVIGLAGFTLIIAGGLVAAVAGRNIAAIGALVAFVVAIIGYNAIESIFSLMAFLGVILVAARAPVEMTSSNLATTSRISPV
ncbi:hypothetical protein D8S82_17205 [Mycobacterium hodleri]|uniref:O-antigen ligase domain-containing protein n=1 Tax=Mycolicibacterium hodleri TaxID=49897 RepID=A0A544VZE7_9MYCO|nr:hypothetical protein [Mycolicibacterium hodleri]TQR85366.1 hypothetical protein D8S82_17205 [Mycolicibacterium hodleri]